MENTVKKEDFIREFVDIICKNSSSLEEIRSLISAVFSFNTFVSELGAWNDSWVNTVSDMKKVIEKSSNDSNLISNTEIIGDTFIQGIILASQNSQGSGLLIKIEDEVNSLIDKI